MTSSEGPVDENEDCDSRSSKSSAGSFNGAVALDACRRPLLVAMGTVGREILNANRPRAVGSS
jgi:hypothetical protein